MRSVTAVLGAATLMVALSACTPSLESAVENCARSFADTLEQTQDGGLTAEGKELVLQDGREMCRTFADDDPDGFLEDWG